MSTYTGNVPFFNGEKRSRNIFKQTKKFTICKYKVFDRNFIYGIFIHEEKRVLWTIFQIIHLLLWDLQHLPIKPSITLTFMPEKHETLFKKCL